MQNAISSVPFPVKCKLSNTGLKNKQKKKYILKRKIFLTHYQNQNPQNVISVYSAFCGTHMHLLELLSKAQRKKTFKNVYFGINCTNNLPVQVPLKLCKRRPSQMSKRILDQTCVCYPLISRTHHILSQFNLF